MPIVSGDEHHLDASTVEAIRLSLHALSVEADPSGALLPSDEGSTPRRDRLAPPGRHADRPARRPADPTALLRSARRTLVRRRSGSMAT